MVTMVMMVTKVTTVLVLLPVLHMTCMAWGLGEGSSRAQ